MMKKPRVQLRVDWGARGKAVAASTAPGDEPVPSRQYRVCRLRCRHPGPRPAGRDPFWARTTLSWRA